MCSQPRDCTVAVIDGKVSMWQGLERTEPAPACDLMRLGQNKLERGQLPTGGSAVFNTSEVLFMCVAHTSKSVCVCVSHALPARMWLIPVIAQPRRHSASFCPSPPPRACSKAGKEMDKRARKRFQKNNSGNYVCISSGRVWELFLKGWKEFLLLISIQSQRKSN